MRRYLWAGSALRPDGGRGENGIGLRQGIMDYPKWIPIRAEIRNGNERASIVSMDARACPLSEAVGRSIRVRRCAPEWSCSYLTRQVK